jgi:predicted RNA-binding protein YlqC (UPF0109 family)
LGLGGITDKIQNIIKRVRGPIEKAIDWVIGKATKHAKSFAGKFNKTKVGKKLGAAKESALKKKEATDKWVNQKKEAAQKRFEQKKAAVQKGLEDKKNQLLNTKAGKKLAAADEWANKKLDVLEKKREAFNNKLETVKEGPTKKLAALEEKAQGLKAAAKDKFKQSKFGQKLDEKLDVTKDLGNKKKDAIKNKDGKDSNKQDELEHDRKVKKGLAHLHQEESRYAKNGKITHKDAKKVAAKVKSKHSIFKSITVVGAVGEWKYEYVASPPKQELSDYEIIQQFGNQYRDLNVDPDKSGEGGVYQGGKRVDDAPIVDDFRKSYNKLESWNIFIKTKHSQLYDEFKDTFAIADRSDWITDVKKATKDYKDKFRNLANSNTTTIEEAYIKKVNEIKTEIDKQIKAIEEWYKSKRGTALPQEQESLSENVHEEGTKLWREAWKNAIIKVNTIISEEWPSAKGNIEVWVQQKKRERPDVNMEGEIGKLDYIGSLAKGYKGPPKQHVRFDPEKFDVDANLEAPPLASYGQEVDKAPVDRGRIFGRQCRSMSPLHGFVSTVENRLAREVVGYDNYGKPSKEIEEPFDVAIKAEEPPQEGRVRVSTEELCDLRSQSKNERNYEIFIDSLKAQGFVEENKEKEGQYIVSKNLTEEQRDKLSRAIASYKRLNSA